MSAILVTFPSAPQVSQDAIEEVHKGFANDLLVLRDND